MLIRWGKKPSNCNQDFFGEHDLDTRTIDPTPARKIGAAISVDRIFSTVPVPLVTRCDDYPGPEAAKTLIVFLPGLGDAPEDFEQHGFIRAVRKTGLLADLVVVDAHYGYYANKSILHRLHEDVFKPAKQRGYDYYWLVGISLGGFGALLYTSHHESDVTGIVAVAPYLGRPSLIDEIAGTVSLQREQPNEPAEDEGHASLGLAKETES